MKALDVLKKAWKKEENSYDQVTEKDIYGMLHQKSSSIVKWILIISILEFAFWNVFAFVFSDYCFNVLRKAALRTVLGFAASDRVQFNSRPLPFLTHN